MRLFDLFTGRKTRGTASEPPRLEALEDRCAPATGVLAAGTLLVNGTPNSVNLLDINPDGAQLVVLDHGVEIARFDSAAVDNIVVNANGLFNVVHVNDGVFQPTEL